MFSEKIWAKKKIRVLRFFSWKKKISTFFGRKKSIFFEIFHKNKAKWYQKNAVKGRIRHQHRPNMCRNDSQMIFETQHFLCDFGLFSEKFTCPILEERCFDEKLQSQISPATGQRQGSYFTTL